MESRDIAGTIVGLLAAIIAIPLAIVVFGIAYIVRRTWESAKWAAKLGWRQGDF